MIAIVDYGAGNLVSVKKAVDWLGDECAITSDPAEVEKATNIILPGVGHFASTATLGRSGLRDAIGGRLSGACRSWVFVWACSGCLGESGIAGDGGIGPVSRRMRALSGKREIAACGME